MRQPINIAATSSHLYCFADDRTIWSWVAGKSEWVQMPGLPDSQDDAQNPFSNEGKPTHIVSLERKFDKDWNLTKDGEWLKQLKRVGAPIGPGNFRHWMNLVTTYRQAQVEKAVAASEPDKRWPSDVEKLLIKWLKDGRSDEAVF
jgi:hypothetical protein